MTTTYIDPCAGCECKQEACILTQGQCHYKKWAEQQEEKKEKAQQKVELDDTHSIDYI